MLVLPLSRPPATGQELAEALRTALSSALSSPPTVKIAGSWPALDTLSVDLSGGQIISAPPFSAGGSEAAAFTAGRFDLKGLPVRYESARANLLVEASKVRFSLAGAGPLAISVAEIDSGNFSLSIDRAELEALVQAVARQAAEPQGVEIQGVKMEIAAEGPSAVSFRAHVTARKLFMAATIILDGHLAVDSSLVAHLERLDCRGNGIAGSMACNFLKPYLDRFNNRSFALASFGLGEAGVTELRLDPGEPLRVTASFGKTATSSG